MGTLPAKVGSEFLVNTQIAGDQKASAITYLISGAFVVTWSDNSGALGDASGSSIKAQLFSSDGKKIGGELLVNTETLNNQLNPAITALDNGGFVITWEDGNTHYLGSGTLGDSNQSLKAQIFDGDGQKLGSEFLVNTFTNGLQSAPSITGLKDGAFVVTWTDTSFNLGDTDTGLSAQIFNASGEMVGAAFRVNSLTSNVQYAPRIANLAGGGFVVTWYDFTGAFGDKSGYSCKAQIFDGMGNKVGDGFQINTQTKGTQSTPSVVGLNNGGFVVTWYDESGTLGDNSNTSIKAQIFDSFGAKVGEEFLVNTQTAFTQQAPDIAALSDGSFIITWEDYSRTFDDYPRSIRAQVFSSDGAKIGGEFVVNTFTNGDQNSPSITSSSNGNFAITWSDTSRSLGDYLGMSVKAQVFKLDEAPVIGSNGGGDNTAISTVEFTTAVTTVQAVDPDASGTLTYSISGGPDAARFQIDAATGALRFKTVPNFEAPADVGGNNVYDLIVRVSDGFLSDTQAIAVTVTNTNVAPAITSNGDGANAQVTALENSTSLGSVTASDPDAGATLRFSIAGGVDGSLFKINGQTGALFFRASPDFEAPKDTGKNNVYDVIIQVSDGTLSDRQSIAVTVRDVVNEVILGSSGPNTLTGAVGNDTLKGGAGNDALFGNGGNDVLDGGKDADRMEGGSGNDTYIIDNVKDVVVEVAGQGTDTVKTGLSYSLGADFENLALIGSNNLSAKGNAFANRISGNAGDNTLMGFAGNDSLTGGDGSDTLFGGEGKDVLAGGSGRDFFVFDTAPSLFNVDKITDFDGSENDKIQLNQNLFKGVTHIGALNPDEFHAAAGAKSAHDASDRVIYDTTSGKLYYDPDGSGGISAVQVALLGSTNHPTLIYTDIQIIV